MKSKKPRVSNQLRIIAGQWRGRKLNFPDGEGLRPTIDRVRETLFNWLRGDVAGARCLDLFSGSGALGLEALSHGAAQCTFVEKNSVAVASLKANLALLKCDVGSVVAQDAFEFLARQSRPFDLIFLDPPFGQSLLQRSIDEIAQRQLLSPTGLIYLESELDLTALTLPVNWELVRHKKAGQSHYGLLSTTQC
ncbi:MAG: 16S rRNA (guanine(966)-N(2))-methyltransferase RsmD [Gammaproteobacteria bacterium]|nr:16S rRNA (guanine(966)-N(2))-methyltransferase RsmD [Gammaproteobacteria bacterium]